MACVLWLGRATIMAEPFVSSNATVVLFCGLPGDADSENRYKDQLQGWFELLDSAGPIKRCLAFSDQPSSIRAVAGMPVLTLKADREHFLSLPDLLGPDVKTLRVIVWGHGGKQGAAPVLHVRGPRITAADLVNVSDRLPVRDSEWVLLFRGSGGFAQALGARGSAVVASESDMMFESDPIGMELLLKTMRAHPAVAFPDLAELLGRSTREWYGQRNLARTEEPTLWADGQVRALDSREPHPPDAEPGAMQHELANSSLPPGELGPKSDRGLTEDVAPAWEQIRKVNPEKFPGVDAVVLYSRNACAWGNAPLLQTEKDEYIQVLQSEGKRFGDFDISYSPPDEELEFLSCEVLGPDGKLVRADPERIGTSGERAPGEYQSRRRKIFSLPGVVPGAVLHVRYRSEWRDYPLPRLSLEIPVIREVPVLKATLSVSTPRGSAFHYRFEGVTAPQPAIEQGQYSATYTWQLTNLAADVRETLGPPHRRPGLTVSTFADWPEFAQWYSRLVRMTAQLSPQLQQRAADLTRGLSSPREKVQAIYSYVTGLRYVAIPLGVSSIRPHTAQGVLHNQFGDCKDKANLLNSLLQCVGVDARLALVPRFRQAHQDLPAFSFNHAISQVSLEGQTFWLDSTDEQSRCGWLPPGDPGRNALVIGGSNVELTALPSPNPEANRMRIEGKLTLSEPSADWSLDMTVTSAGYPDYSLRRALHQAKDQLPTSPLLSESFQPVAGSFALERQSSTEVSDLAHDFTWKGQGSCVGLSSDFAGKVALHAPFWLPREWDLALNRRRTTLFLDEGYPLRIEEDFAVVVPPELSVESVPPVQENPQAPLSWRIEWIKSSERALVARLHAELASGELSAADTAGFQSQLRRLRAALGADALFVRQNFSSASFKATQN